MIHLAICEDQSLMRLGLVNVLKEYPGIAVVNSSENGKVLLDTIEDHTLPDVILMDVDMPMMNGFETTRAITKKYSKVKILMLSSHINEAFINNAIKAGAHGYLHKNEHPDEIHTAIVEVFEQGFYFNELISRESVVNFVTEGCIHPEFKQHALNTNEIEIIRLICQEKTAEEIAEIMCLGENTINTYRQNIQKKLGVKKSTGLVVYAIKNGIYIP